ncbi:unnamed protein product [Ambrosiozyma monospora]|uniref:Unnamed protein product n=1 Tax=Ambrosiozyma monospora TaxID=43982 RepID=A0ACB5TIW7_AMBMO|nr:unnamed protein product [Ambrosiozyma monospora]
MFCDPKFKCQSRISVRLDKRKGLFSLRYVDPPVHNHSSEEVVELAKERLKPTPMEHAAIKEDNRFQIELSPKVNWMEYVPKLKIRQSHKLEPGALELIHQTYTNLIESKAGIIHVFTISQFLQLISVYLPFLSLTYANKVNSYIYCCHRLKCNMSMVALKMDREKGLFYLRYVHPPVHNHSSHEIVEQAKQEYAKFIDGEQDSVIDSYPKVEESLGDKSRVGNQSNGSTNRALRVPTPSKLITFQYSTRRAKLEIQASSTASATLNEENDDNDDNEYQNPVKVEVDDDDYDFSDHESLDHEGDEAYSQEHDMYAGTTFISPQQGSMISQVTHSLLFEQGRFTDLDGLNGLRDDLEGFMYYAKRLYDSID